MHIESITLNGITIIFGKGINIVSGEAFDAVKAVLLRRIIDTNISARVNMNGEIYTVNISCGNMEVYKNGILANDEYFSLFKTFPEQKAFFDFNNLSKIDYSKIFMFYKDIGFFYPKKVLRYATFGICDTRSFRKHLNDFIESYNSNLMKFNSKYKLVNCGSLSKEQFNFNCFLLLSDFWDGFNKIRDFHCVPQPITVKLKNMESLPEINRQIFIKEERQVKTPKLRDKRLGDAWLYLLCLEGAKDVKTNKDDLSLADASATINGKTLGLILYNGNTEFVKDRIDELWQKYDYICLMFFKSKLRAELEKQIPKKCGLLCCDNAYGLGCVYNLYRKWE